MEKPNKTAQKNNKCGKKKLKIWLIQHGEPLPVVPKTTSFRTARLSKELASRGHEVTYWCSSFWHHKKIVYCKESKMVKVDNYNLYILHAGAYKSNHSIGRYFHHKKMAKLFSEEAKKMGENGRKAVLEKYNWENESKKILEVYERLLTK